MNMIHLIAPPASLTDEELLQRLAAGHDDALEPLHQRYAGRVFAFAARRLDPDAADDITQEVFLAIWNNAGRFDPARGAAKPWILQIAHLRILNEFRRRERRPQLAPDPEQKRLDAAPDRAPSPDEAAWRQFQQRAVTDAVTKLPPRQREAVALTLFDDLTQAQVAVTLQVPLGTAKTRIRDGMQRLRGALLPLVAGAAIAVAAGQPGAGAPHATSNAPSTSAVMRVVGTGGAMIRG